jgi:hypothetical protein
LSTTIPREKTKRINVKDRTNVSKSRSVKKKAFGSSSFPIPAASLEAVPENSQQQELHSATSSVSALTSN